MASSPIDIVKVFYGTFSLMGAEKAGQFLADDFMLVGLTPEPMDRSAWMSFLAALKQAIPDLKIRLETVTESGTEVIFVEKGLGTHTETMDMSGVGLADIPSSGLAVSFPSLQWRLTVQDGKICHAELLTSPSEDTGLAGVVKAFNMRPILAD